MVKIEIMSILDFRFNSFFPYCTVIHLNPKEGEKKRKKDV